jgi:hypothetical protein
MTVSKILQILSAITKLMQFKQEYYAENIAFHAGIAEFIVVYIFVNKTRFRTIKATAGVLFVGFTQYAKEIGGVLKRIKRVLTA